jgi:N-methylhydantoinase B
VFHVGGLNQYGEPFGGAVTEALSGGGGATAGADGVDTAGPHEILEYKFANVETDEAHFPLLWLRRELDTDGAGAGRRRGGSSLNSSFTVHDAPFVHGVMMCNSLSMPSTSGLHGGLPGSTHHVAIARGTTISDELAAGSGIRRGEDAGGDFTDYSGTPGEMLLFPGDVIDWSFHGGGGWGDPLDADPARVLRDVVEHRVSEEAAERLYGVVIVFDAVDDEGTARVRARLRSERLAWLLSPAADVPEVAADAERTPVGDRLVLVTAEDGSRVLGCECGHLLSPSTVNWKLHARRAPLDDRDLGEKVRLHPALVAEGFACPGCGSLLGIEVRAVDDPVLHDFEIP